ncbi:RHS repeat-associated core domain-containing protein [Streptomyces sp. NPDC048436]|uniref:RHS repeat-associated core domain-containing protein n=1 Tax=Streptomyces sp. NPDC048436 TaxID=3365550 RepID=UPI00371350C5
MADESGAKVNSYSYCPRGVTRSASGEKAAQPYRFADDYQDPTDMYLANRYYDPNTGRFTQPDPLYVVCGNDEKRATRGPAGPALAQEPAAAAARPCR